MSMKTGDYIVQRLAEWGVERVYGYPGDGINGLLGAFERHQDQVRFVQVRHEEMAAFMACGQAKWTGEVAVCCATSGPGAIHLLNGLYDAKLDHQPVVAVVGQTYVRAMGGHYQQEVDLHSLFKDVASAYVEQADTPAAVRHMLDRAIRIAKAERTVTCVIVPADVQQMEAVPQQPHATHTIHSGAGWSEPRVIPRDEDLRRAADVLNSGRRPEEVERAWDEALAADRPVVIDAIVDPEEPPLPPHITFEQAKNFARSLLGEPDRAEIVEETVRGMAEEVLPRRR